MWGFFLSPVCRPALHGIDSVLSAPLPTDTKCQKSLTNMTEPQKGSKQGLKTENRTK